MSKASFYINNKVLYRALYDITKYIVSSNPVVPILECVRMEWKSDWLSLTTSNLQVDVNVQLPIDTKEEGSICVPARRLMQFLYSLPMQPIGISVEEDYTLMLESELGEYRFSGEPATDFPKTNWKNGEETMRFSAYGDRLSKNFKRTLEHASFDELRPAMCGLHLTTNSEKGELLMEGTDGHRLARVRMDAECKTDSSLILPRIASQVIVNLCKNAEAVLFLGREIANDAKTYMNHHGQFVFGNTTVTTRLIDERYPNTENVIPKQHSTTAVVDRIDFRKALSRAYLMANRTTHQVVFHFALKTPDRLSFILIEAKDIDFKNSLREKFASIVEGKPLTIGFNARLLQSVIDSSEEDEITIQLTEPNKAAIVSSGDRELFLVMPVMITDHTEYTHPDYASALV